MFSALKLKFFSMCCHLGEIPFILHDSFQFHLRNALFELYEYFIYPVLMVYIMLCLNYLVSMISIGRIFWTKNILDLMYYGSRELQNFQIRQDIFVDFYCNKQNHVILT